jgi:hypothetical protein
MPIYDAAAETRLLDKLDYELWLLEFLAEGGRLFPGGAEPETIKLQDNEMTAAICIGFTEHVGAGYGQQILNAMLPLVFTASYKVLDMVYEWILEENRSEGVISTFRWPFAQKIQLIRNTSLRYPLLFGAQPYLREYSFMCYEKLLPFRNQVVHDHNFSVDTERVELVIGGAGARLTLHGLKLGCLVRFAISLAKCLSGTTTFEVTLDRYFKYYLDQLASVHCLAAFGQTAPLLANVELTTIRQGNIFPAHLRLVRETLRRIHPNVDVLFNLAVLARDGGTLVARWQFPAASVPESDVEFLSLDSYAQFRKLN